jgi:hypothetical protein
MPISNVEITLDSLKWREIEDKFYYNINNVRYYW